MKVIVALLIIGFVAATNAADIQCPPRLGEEDNILVPNPKDCATYYDCNLGYPILMKCPPNLHWNKFKTQCDWKAEACCDSTYDPYNTCPKSL